MEIERKWLVRQTPSLAGAVAWEIRQGYLAVDPSGREVRIRSKDGACTLTVKHGAGLRRQEWETPIPPTAFRDLWPATEGRRVVKRRISLPVGSHIAEIDQYGDELRGLATVEVEFESEGAAVAFETPAWFGPEVTDDPRYSNQRLALSGHPDGS